MKRIVWEKCQGSMGEHYCDIENKPDYAVFKNVRTGKYYCAYCLFEEKEFDKRLSETLKAYHK